MDRKNQKRISRFMSLVLRHQPQMAGLTLDTSGWVDVVDLLRGLESVGRTITRQQLEQVVAENDKQRFQFDDAKQRIRATQGHSVEVDLGYASAEPPDLLYHGTPLQFAQSIRRQGLRKQKRHHVHLHQDLSVATEVGRRRGQPVVFIVEAGRMNRDGHPFFVTPNRVWLTDAVPPDYLRTDEILETN